MSPVPQSSPESSPESSPPNTDGRFVWASVGIEIWEAMHNSDNVHRFTHPIYFKSGMQPICMVTKFVVVIATETWNFILAE